MADLPKAGVQLVAEDASAFSQSLLNASKSVTGLEQSLNSAGPAGTKFGSVMTGALERVGHIAVNALGSAASALGSFISSSVAGAADYEQSMNVLQSTTQATDEQMAAVKETAKALGADLTLPATSAASAGQAMNYLAQQGLSVDEAMAAAKGTLQLAAAGMVDEKEAALTTATALNQFGLQGAEATRIADLLAASVSASGSGVAQTGQAIQQAGTAFASAHVPIEDFITLVNEMSKAGIKGSDAGTSLKTMMQRLQAPTAKAANEMEKLGISVYDSQGSMRPMRDIIDQFSKSLGGLTQKERDQAVVTIFGSDAQRAANIVLAGGTDAYDKMRAAVTRQGAASALAGAQMKGLNGAVAGLGSQLETLALEAIEPLLPLMAGAVTQAAELAGSFVGKVGPAVSDVIGFLTTAGAVINDTALPALSGLTTALIVYATVQAVQATPAILASIPAIAAQTAAFVANAAAIIAAVAPYALIVAAVGGVVYAYQNFVKANTTATDQLLDSKPFWTESTAALESYGQQSGETAAQLKPLAENISYMRDLIHEEIESLAKRREAGLVSDAQFQQEMATINQHAKGLQAATQAYDNQEQALIKATAASMTATNQTEVQSGALGDNVTAVELDEKALEDLGKQLEKTFKEGTQAVQDYTTQAAGFMEQLQDTSKKTQDRITTDQAKAYAEQAAAQRTHLGEMLSDYTLAQTKLGNITSAQADVILGAIEKQFGIADDSSARTFLHMEQSIDAFAANGGTSIDELSGTLGSLQDDAVETKIKMDALATKYTAELVQNFQEGKIDADEFRKALEQIPRRVSTEVHTEYTSEGTPPAGATTGSSGAGHNATGGQVGAGQLSWVGEQGRELALFGQAARIIPHDQSMRIAQTASAAQIMATPANASASSYTDARQYHYQPTYAQTPRAPATDFALMQALATA